jgi:4-diphosphocytidyl-2-C-methyl-D-erythritol kinase
MLAFANAKINLGLNITEKRADGYHNIETVFYPIQLNDVVEIVDSTTNSCVVKGIDVPGNSDDNLCLKAFKALQRDFKLPNQQIVLLKNIPVGAGLGGGSADAAFLIKLVNEKFSLGLNFLEMEDYARVLGADCAFFIKNKPVFAFGKGDEFEDLEIDLSAYQIVLVKPPIHVSTADAYYNVKVKPAERSLKELIKLPVRDWKNCVFNDFETSVFAKYPQISELKDKLYAAGATFALMIGSGSSVFALFENPVQLPQLEKGSLIFEF